MDVGVYAAVAEPWSRHDPRAAADLATLLQPHAAPQSQRRRPRRIPATTRIPARASGPCGYAGTGRYHGRTVGRGDGIRNDEHHAMATGRHAMTSVASPLLSVGLLAFTKPDIASASSGVTAIPPVTSERCPRRTLSPARASRQGEGDSSAARAPAQLRNSRPDWLHGCAGGGVEGHPPPLPQSKTGSPPWLQPGCRRAP